MHDVADFRPSPITGQSLLRAAEERMIDDQFMMLAWHSSPRFIQSGEFCRVYGIDEVQGGVRFCCLLREACRVRSR